MTHHEKVWNTLVAYCGACDDRDYRRDFLRYADTPYPLEFRFHGSLGPGGKVHFAAPMRVSCYPEDETPSRKRAIATANKLLGALWGERLRDFSEAGP